MKKKCMEVRSLSLNSYGLGLIKTIKSDNSKNNFNLSKEDWLDFYVLVRSSVNFGPILDFKVSTDSLDPGDFKNGLKTLFFLPEMP